MADVLEHPCVTVNGREIDAALIAAEVQNHPAPDPDQAWEAAARALVLRQLLLDEADRLEIMSVGLVDAEGRKLADEDARIEALLEQEVQCPHADETVTRRFYTLHSNRFRSPTLVEAEHILFAASPTDSLAYGLATGDARTTIRASGTARAFAELALKHSACPSKEQGGNLGADRARQTVQEFRRCAVWA
ncbi:MAG: peptidylprolyl isomerase [Sphingomonadales bacterium]|nr:peptidylprolyl isomerase [Sphingomonadales bacterium]